MVVVAPGLRPQRLLTLVRRSIDAMSLDLGGATVLTEAATGAYVVTPVIAALAGASTVHAVTKPTRFGTIADVTRETRELAELAGVGDRIAIEQTVSADIVAASDVVTNSGHVRPIDAPMIQRMKQTCVVPLMFEAWEIDAGRVDVDLEALRSRGIRFAGTNERHPSVGVFSYLGSMAVKLLGDAQVAVHGSRILLLCDNPFAPYLEDGLTRAGATVVTRPAFSEEGLAAGLDAIVLSLTPHDRPALDSGELEAIAHHAPGAVVAQFWGDLPRGECDALGIPYVPSTSPGNGHMGVLPSAVGPEPVVRLQAGGLKVAEVLARPPERRSAADVEYLDEL
jgi:hypothetical protein